MKLRTFFRTHPVFTVEDFAGFLSSDGTHNLRTQESLLAYHVKAGSIVRVRRGLYAVVPPGAAAATARRCPQSSLSERQAGSQGRHSPEPFYLRCPAPLDRHRSQLCGCSGSGGHARRTAQD